MASGASKMALGEKDNGEPVGAEVGGSDSIGSVQAAGNELDSEAVPEQDSDIRNPAQAINEPVNKEIMVPTGRTRVEIENLPAGVGSGEYGSFIPDQGSTDQPRLDADSASQESLGPWIKVDDHAKLDPDEAAALLSDLNAVQAERNEDEDEDEEEEALALLLALGSAVGLPRQLDMK